MDAMTSRRLTRSPRRRGRGSIGGWWKGPGTIAPFVRLRSRTHVVSSAMSPCPQNANHPRTLYGPCFRAIGKRVECPGLALF